MQRVATNNSINLACSCTCTCSYGSWNSKLPNGWRFSACNCTAARNFILRENERMTMRVKQSRTIFGSRIFIVSRCDPFQKTFFLIWKFFGGVAASFVLMRWYPSRRLESSKLRAGLHLELEKFTIFNSNYMSIENAGRQQAGNVWQCCRTNINTRYTIFVGW